MFADDVWNALRLLPKGSVITYAALAGRIGRPRAARAVGNALHRNPAPEIFPCFRVVNAKGGLARHFGLGMEEQRRRLQADGIEVRDDRVDLNEYAAREQLLPRRVRAVFGRKELHAAVRKRLAYEKRSKTVCRFVR